MVDDKEGGVLYIFRIIPEDAQRHGDGLTVLRLHLLVGFRSEADVHGKNALHLHGIFPQSGFHGSLHASLLRFRNGRGFTLGITQAAVIRKSHFHIQHFGHIPMCRKGIIGSNRVGVALVQSFAAEGRKPTGKDPRVLHRFFRHGDLLTCGGGDGKASCTPCTNGAAVQIKGNGEQLLRGQLIRSRRNCRFLGCVSHIGRACSFGGQCGLTGLRCGDLRRLCCLR